jgi:hypothetical protein
MRTAILLVLSSLLSFASSAQKVLQIERYGRVKTKKMYIGQEITYQLKNDDGWYRGVIEDLDVEKNWIVMRDRYVPLDSIAAFRRPQNWSRAARTSLYTFGAGWSANALVGTLTDGNPATNYLWSDAVVTGTSWLTGWILPKIFKNKITKFGKKRRLRMLDLTFKQGAPIKA